MASSEKENVRQYRGMPVPVMLHLLQLIETETREDVILGGVSRTLSQAIDELTAIERTAVDVMSEMHCQIAVSPPRRTIERRRLC